MKKWFKGILYVLGSVIILLIVFVFTLQTNWAKNIIRNKIQDYFATKTKTVITIASIDYSLPNWVQLNGVYLEDQSKDTLLFGKQIKVEVAMLKLLQSTYQINSIVLDNVYINLTKKDQDKHFNYQFIIDAFSGNTNSKKDSLSSVDLKLKDIAIHQLRFNKIDSSESNFLQFSVEDFKLTVDSINLTKMRLGIKKLYANNLQFAMQILKPSVEKVDSNPFTFPTINANNISIENSNILYSNEPLKMYTNNTINKLQLLGFSNLKNANTFTIQSLLLKQSTILFNHALKDKIVIAKKDTLETISTTNSNLNFIVDSIQLLQNNITYNNTAKPEKLTELDYYHIALKNSNLKAYSTSYVNGFIESNINQLKFKDKSGFSLDSFSGLIKIDSSRIAVNKLVVRTPNSSINTNAIIYLNSLSTPKKGEGKLPENDIVISNTIIGRKDLEILTNGLTKKYKKQLNILGNILVNATLKGNNNTLVIKQLKIQSSNPKQFNTEVNGTIKNVLHVKKIQYNLSLQNTTISSKLIYPFLKETKQKIVLPNFLNANGSVAGNMQNIDANITTNSEFGKATIKAKLQGFNKPATMVYDVVIIANNFETGKWIGQDSILGKFSGTIAANGNKGFDIRQNNLKLNTNILSIRYKENTIKNIKISAQGNKGLVSGNASIQDNLATIFIKGKANVASQYPTIDALVNIKNADIKTLGFSTDSLIISGISKIKINNSTPTSLDAFIRIDSAFFIKNNQKIVIDSATIIGYVQHDSTILNLVSPIANATVKSTVYYNKMQALLQEVFTRFSSENTAISQENKTQQKVEENATIQAAIVLKPNKAYQILVKDMLFTEPINISALVINNKKDSAIKVAIDINQLQLSSLHFSSTKGSIISKGDSLKLTLTADTIKAANLFFYDALVNGNYSKKNISFALNTKDENKIEQFKIAANAQPNNVNGYTIILNKALMLNKKNWIVKQSNSITTSTEGFVINDFEITNNNEKIAVNNQTKTPNSPILIAIDNFKLGNITAALNKDSMALEGLLNAKIKVSDVENAIPTMDGIIKVDSLLYNNTSIGNISINAQSTNGNVALTGKLQGNENNVDITGNYTPKAIDVKVNLNPITIASIQPFTANNLANSKGTINGVINITGAANNPEWNGLLNFNKVQTTASKFGTVIKVDNQQLSFNYPNINFINFTLLDSTNNPVVINGVITQNTDKNFITNLTVKTKKFNALNNTSADNNMLYGKAIIDADATIKGAVTAPDITGDITIKNGTKVTFVRQNTPPSAKDREGVMEFIQMDTIANLLTKNTYQDVLAIEKKQSNIGSLNYNLNLEIEEDAKFNIIIDPITRDELEVQGVAQINAGVNPSGNVALAGTYNLKKGSYILNYQFLKRKFLLQDGSTITLTGDPKKATADITAAYEITTSAFDLIGSEVSNATSADNTIFKRKVPFKVLLKIKGEIMSPELSFDIVVKEKAEGVSYQLASTIENKLQQLRTDPSALNKQVFALLVLNRFIGEQSRDFFAGNGANSSILANESVSGFLNGAINQIAADLVKGVDIDINLKNVNDDPNAQRTDLSVALSKSFLDDRLSVSVGKSFTIEGDDPSAKGRNTANNNVQFIPDVNTTYKLSKDGKYMLRAYRKNQYEALLDGYFIETGLAFTFTMDYNKFKELLQKKPKT